MARAALAALVLAACSRSPRDAAPAQPIGERAPASAAAADAAATDAGAGADCVAACVKARQMVAMSIEAIEADCRRTCAAEPTSFAP